MLHSARENCDSMVILLIVVVRGKVEAFVVDAVAIFFLDKSEVGCARTIFRDWRPGPLSYSLNFRAL